MLTAKLAVATTITVVLLVVMEFAAGLFVIRPDDLGSTRAISGDAVSTTLAYLWINPTPLRLDPYLLWSNQPNATRTQHINPQPFGSDAEWTIENNSQGFRGSEVGSDSPTTSAFRVLCIGDSVTFGFNADQDDSYPVRLAEILRSFQPDRDIEVINAGVPGWSWLQGVRFLEREGLALQPDLVVMAHGVNDQLMQAMITDAERFELADDPTTMLLAKTRSWAADTNIYQLVEQWSDATPPPGQPSPGCQKQIKVYGQCKRVAPKQIEAAIERADQLAKSSNFDFLVLNLDFLRTRAVAAARRATRARGIPFVDLARRMDVLRGKAQRERSKRLGLLPSSGQASRRNKLSLQSPSQVIFRVQTPDGGARYSARGLEPHPSEFVFGISLNDEGREGDENPGDGVFSATLDLPPGVNKLNFKFYRGQDREFNPLPPFESRLGDRSLRIDGNQTTPVYLFADRFMMSERTHPNADGYAMVAEAVAQTIRNRPSFIHQ